VCNVEPRLKLLPLDLPAAVGRHTIVEAMRTRFGVSFQIWPFAAQLLVDLFVLASEIGGAAMAMQIAIGGSARMWAVPVAALVWALLWFATFSTIENGVALLGLVTLCFVVAVFKLGPAVHDLATGLIPRMPASHAGQYGYLAVGILGATISPFCSGPWLRFPLRRRPCMASA
jgi:Mn2+/Fe2+ NRAMP family transporter